MIDTLTHWLRHTPARWIAAGLALTGWYATRIEPRWLRVRRLVITSARFPSAFDGYRIAHFSDLHLGVPQTDAYLPGIVQAVQREAPDLIAMTGDLLTWRRENRIDQTQAVADLRQLHAPDGVWAVLGNHDYMDPALARDLLAQADITLLRNTTHVLQRGADQCVLAGLDDVVRGRPDLHATLCDVPPNMPVILLAHEPDFAKISSVDARIVLQLSGHTHGGQITPVRSFLPQLPKFGHIYVRGYYSVRGMALIVTTGTGTGRFAVRFNCRPDITLITLRHLSCN
jgi:uncharacterized protein